MNERDSLLPLAFPLCDSLAAGNFVQAEALFARFCKEAEDAIQALGESSPERARVAREARQALEQACRLARIARAHAAAELRRVPNLSLYRPPQAKTPHILSIRG